MSWTDERIALLKKLWEDGLSCSQIAARLGGDITRNAVIGKRKRLGIPDRGMDRPRMRRGKPPANAHLFNGRLSKGGASKSASKIADQPPPPVPYIEAPTTDIATRTLATLERDECRWPIGDPKSPTFGYCGCKKIPGKPYCEPHDKRAFTPVVVAMKRKAIQHQESVSVAAESVREREGVS
jgi:GcrA cell cycle regulator